MRLKPDQIQQIHLVLKSIGEAYTLYLYGSRTQDDLKGGDIDLLVITESSKLSLFQDKLLDLLVQIKKQPAIGDRRIDLKFASPEQLKTHAFLKSIRDQLIELKTEKS